jgi:AcrR family transcriptional regulator
MLTYAEDMRARTVDWPASGSLEHSEPEAEGLRDRKKRLMRQQLTDTATQMFMERGFDAVRVTEIAEACGVSEKTVFNYFPTKESLILDRLESTMASLKSGLADPGVLPTDAALRILDDELGAMTSWLAAQQDPVEAGAAIRRFGALIQDTPSLRAYQSDMMDQFTAVAAGILAARADVSPDDPEPQIAAIALLGLWRVQFQALSRYLDGTRTPGQVHQAVTADVHRAARLISTGLNSFSAFTPAQRGAAGQPLRLSRSGRIMRWCGAPRHQRPDIPGCIGIGGSGGMSPDVRGAAFSRVLRTSSSPDGGSGVSKMPRSPALVIPAAPSTATLRSPGVSEPGSSSSLRAARPAADRWGWPAREWCPTRPASRSPSISSCTAAEPATSSRSGPSTLPEAGTASRTARSTGCPALRCTAWTRCRAREILILPSCAMAATAASATRCGPPHRYATWYTLSSLSNVTASTFVQQSERQSRRDQFNTRIPPSANHLRRRTTTPY